MMPDTKKFDGKVYKQIVGSYTIKADANRRASEIRNKGFRGKVTFARVVRSPEKEYGFKKGAGGLYVMQYHWYIYVRETQKKAKRTPTRYPIRTRRKPVY